MKYFLQTCLTVVLLSSSITVFGQHCQITSDRTSPVRLRILSEEQTSISGQVQIQVVLEALQTTPFGSLPYLDQEFTSTIFNEEVIIYNYSGPDTLYSGDSVIHEITLNYDPDNLPFYPTDVVIAYNDTLKRKARLYFTPYNTIEIWDIGDYMALNRTWIAKETANSADPTRISIPQNSIPQSDLPQTGELADSFAVYTVTVLGLAYAIPMLEPDTFNLDSGVVYQSGGNSMNKADNCGFWGHRFRGQISNLRFTSLHIPDGSALFNVTNAVDIGLRDLEVDICADRWPFTVISECSTDDEGFLVNGNGSRTINFDFCTGSGRNDINVFLRIRTHHPTNKSEFKVKYKGNVRGFHEFVTESIQMSYNNDNTQVLSFGTDRGGQREIDVDLLDLGKVYSMLRWAWHYGYLATSGNYKRNFKAIIDTDLADNRGFYRRSSKDVHFAINLIDDIVSLRPGAEFVFYHEFGHFFMFGIYDDDNWQRPNNVNGTHLGERNNYSDNMTMSEGTASGFAFILDEMTASETDGESGRGWAAADYHEQQRLDMNLNTPFLSELVIARIMLDMWDGTNNNAAFNNPIVTGDLNTYFDDVGNGQQDNIELSFNTILSPFWENVGQVNNLPSYYERILTKLDCKGNKDLKRLWLHNFSDHLIGANPRNGVIPEDFMFLNSDIISEFIEVTYVGNEINNFRTVISTNTINTTYVSDVSELNSNSIINLAHVASSTFDIELSDNLIVDNNATLELNSSHDISVFPEFFNIPVYSQLNSTGNYNVCSDLIQIEESGTIQLGNDISNMRVGNLNFKSGSELSIRGNSQDPATLVINDNSRLTIEQGAVLRIGVNNQIILDGSDAILEIRGHLIIEDGATFAPIGGANGQGFVLFNIGGATNYATAVERINVGLNSSMTFTASTPSIKVVEISDNLWIEDKGNTNFTFKVNNGTVEMGQDVFLNLNCTGIFEFANVGKTSAATQRGGVFMWGKDGDKITWSTFKDGKYGLVYIAYYPLSQPSLFPDFNHCTFSDNDIGLRYMAASLYMRHCFVSNNSIYGVDATPSLPGIISNCTFNDNSLGFNYRAGVQSDLVMTSNDFLNNDKGIHFNSMSELQLTCNKFFGHTGYTSDFGIKFEKGQLLMSSRRNSGPNWFENSEKNIELVGNLGLYPKLFIKEGKNQLSNIVSSSDPQIGLWGIIDNSGLSVLDGNFNRWDETTSGANLPVSTYGVGGGFENYSVGTYIPQPPLPSSVLTPLTITDNYALTETAFASNWSSDCPSIQDQKRVFSGNGNIFNDNEGTMINTNSFTNIHLSEAIENVLVWSSDTMTPLTEISGYWKEIITYENFPTPIEPADEYYIHMATSHIASVVGAHFAAGGAIPPQAINETVVQDALNSYDFILNLLDGDTAEYSRILANKVRLKKGHVLFTVDQNSDAIAVFNEVYNDGDSASWAEANYWICQINMIEDLRNGVLDPQFFSDLYDCQYDYEIPGQNKYNPPKKSLKSFVDGNEIVVYPNPTDNEFIIVVLLNSEVICNVKMIDLLGRELNSKEFKTFVGLNRFRYDISETPSGTYQIMLTTPHKVYSRRVMVRH